MKRKRSKNKTQ